MKFFLDENFPKKAKEILEETKNEVFDIRGTDLEGSKDTTIFEKAQEHKAIFLSTDRDFYHTIPSTYKNHNGIIVIALSQPNTKNILQKLNIALNYIKNVTIKSPVILLTDSKMYLHHNE